MVALTGEFEASESNELLVDKSSSPNEEACNQVIELVTEQCSTGDQVDSLSGDQVHAHSTTSYEIHHENSASLRQL